MNYDNLFGKAPLLSAPNHIQESLIVRVEESKEIVQRAITEHKPYAIGLMLSGGDDSITALHVAIMLGVKLDFIMHGVTGTGLKDCRKYVHDVADNMSLKLIEADAKDAFEKYVKRKGFFGVGKTAHCYSYHILKTNPFESALSKNIVKGKPNRKVILLNGVRVEESDNRMDNFGEQTERIRKNQIWVNIIHWWSKKECLDLLCSENIKRSPVAVSLGRSGECNCGTMQNEADRIACAEYDKEWGEWMWDLRKYCIQKFGWDIGQNPKKELIDEIKQRTKKMSDFMPMCVGCKAKQGKLFNS
jgi:3'-phosphoadenosine 5'-phosphosulfate sulfotransferase (PAPS reductase)/FAD synthetase